MSANEPCPRCGSPLPAGADAASCPSCLLRLGLEARSDVVRTGSGAASPPPEPPSSAELAKLFPQLEIAEPLGRGGMGVVYRARQRGLERDVALKILLVRREDRDAFAERFAREARALARLSHPGIVGVHDFGMVGEHWYLTMEYVDGTNLRHLMRSGELRPSQALDVVGQVCAALQAAHEEGVVHRDIKPENILVDRAGRVKIADFGLAKLARGGADRLTGTLQAMGTPHYMAPEQYERPQEVDHRADIFSLGVVFYELLTGELPVGAFDPPSKKVSVDVRLDEVVLKAMRREPDRRYQHASEVGTEVTSIAAGEQVEPTDWAEHHAERRDARRARHRRRTGVAKWAWALGCGLLAFGPLLFLLVGLGGAFFLGVSAEPTAIQADIQPPPPAPADPLAPGVRHTATCDDVDAYAQMLVADDLLARLHEVARRPDLSAHEQQHLIHAVLETAGPTALQGDVLLELLEAQAANPAVAAYLRKALERMPDEAQRLRVLDALPPAGGAGATRARGDGR